jgi:DNA-directed RNA polymerase specialized sigma subunit
MKNSEKLNEKVREELLKKEFLTATEIAKILGITRQWVYQLSDQHGWELVRERPHIWRASTIVDYMKEKERKK